MLPNTWRTRDDNVEVLGLVCYRPEPSSECRPHIHTLPIHKVYEVRVQRPVTVPTSTVVNATLRKRLTCVCFCYLTRTVVVFIHKKDAKYSIMPCFPSHLEDRLLTDVLGLLGHPFDEADDTK